MENRLGGVLYKSNSTLTPFPCASNPYGTKKVYICEPQLFTTFHDFSRKRCAGHLEGRGGVRTFTP